MQTFSSVKPVELKCENKVSPAGIDEKYPRFSWITEYKGYNSFQSAFRIITASSIEGLLLEQGDIWDSDKVISSFSASIKFKGNPLRSNKSYFWKVMIWNENDQPSSWSETAVFSTGLFESSEWEAKWISHICKAQNKTIAFQKGIDKWIWYPFTSSVDRFSSIMLTKTFEIDQVSAVNSAELIVTADEKFILWINDKSAAQSDERIFSWARPSQIEIKSFLIEEINRLQATGLNSYVDNPGFILRLEIKYNSGKTILINTDESWHSSIKSDNLKSVNAKAVAAAGDKPWRIPEPGFTFNPAAYFRKSFEIPKPITRAFIYCSALGLYNLQLNGQRVNGCKLTPVWSNFNRQAYYNSYDVTSLLNSSKNVINVILADGYYSGYCGWEKGRGYYGKYPAFKLQLLITYADGSTGIICSDESWVSSEGPIREADILMGESYDSNYESLIKGWDSLEFQEENFNKVSVITDIDPKLISYKADEIKTGDVLFPKSIITDEDKYLVDFGQNFAGFVRLTLRNTGVSRIVLRFAEVLNEDGTIYTDNIRMARSSDTYIPRADSEEIWEPLFTYHGFRYVEVSGYKNMGADSITGISINSLPEQTAYFISSDPKLNKLFECILWNQKSNYIDIPTDCPQRDERFGWTGDAVSFFKTAAFNFDVSAFYTKWLIDLFNEQREDGSLPPFAPLPDMGVGPVYFNSAGWADAGIVTPFLFHQFYDDLDLLEKYYSRMKLFLKSYENKSDNFILPDYGYGDWLNINMETSKSFISTAYFAYDCKLMQNIASALGFNDEAVYYEELFKKIKKSFIKKFLNPQGLLAQPTQTAAVLAIHFDLLEPSGREKTISYLIQSLIQNNYHITTGFLGLSFLMPVLSSINRNDFAWKVLTNNDYPSWFYMIDNGATTLWERWDSFHPDKGFYDPTMNSFNHCSLGCVGEWLITGVSGINPMEAGFKKIKIKPFIPEGLTYAKASFKSRYGLIRSEWEREGNKLVMRLEIPFNTHAVIVIPSGVYELNKNHKIIKKEDNFTYIETGSGSYEIFCNIE